MYRCIQAGAHFHPKLTPEGGGLWEKPGSFFKMRWAGQDRGSGWGPFCPYTRCIGPVSQLERVIWFLSSQIHSLAFDVQNICMEEIRLKSCLQDTPQVAEMSCHISSTRCRGVDAFNLIGSSQDLGPIKFCIPSGN